MAIDVAELGLPTVEGSSDFDLRCYRQASFVRAFEAKALALTQTTPPVVQGSIHAKSV